MINYNAIYAEIWDTKEFRKLSRDAGYLFIFLCTNPQSTLTGIYELDLDVVLIRSKFGKEEFKVFFEEVCAKMPVAYHNETGYIFIKNKYKRQPGKTSPSVIAGVLKELDMLPANVPFRDEFVKKYHQEIKGYYKLLEHNPNPFNKKSGTPQAPVSVTGIIATQPIAEAYKAMEGLYGQDRRKIKDLLLGHYPEAEVDAVMGKKY